MIRRHTVVTCCLFFFQGTAAHGDLHSSPTHRFSDLWPFLSEQTADANGAPLDEQVTLEQIGYLLESLPVKQKAVVEAIYIDGKSQQEVSDELSIPLGTVKSRTRLALQRLKVMLNDND